MENVWLHPLESPIRRQPDIKLNINLVISDAVDEAVGIFMFFRFKSSPQPYRHLTIFQDFHIAALYFMCSNKKGLRQVVREEEPFILLLAHQRGNAEKISCIFNFSLPQVASGSASVTHYVISCKKRFLTSHATTYESNLKSI